MEQNELRQKLTEAYNVFISTVRKLPDAEFVLSTNGKWAGGQQLAHIIKSVSPVNFAFALPDFVLKMAFGKANRPSRTYQQLVEKYQGKLAQGGKAPKQFVPKSVTLNQREVLIKKLEKLIATLNKRIDRLSEKQLDELLLPHPLMGKLTFREMIYFTIYHSQHHEKQITANLKNQNT
ncbi:MAG: DinB family protein [Cyclobacteriaceae bacterium]|nr:DinB family protein [Cyclobacteriaceae bacterium]